MSYPLLQPRRLIAALATSAALVGCVTIPPAYTGPGPRLDLTGDKAQEEIRTFTLNEDTFRRNLIELGPEHTPYEFGSYYPIMTRVSPEAGQRIAVANTYAKAQLIGLGVGVGGLIAALATQDESARFALEMISITGSVSSIVFSFFAAGAATNAAVPYNRDLRRQLTPSVGLNFTY